MANKVERSVDVGEVTLDRTAAGAIGAVEGEDGVFVVGDSSDSWATRLSDGYNLTGDEAAEAVFTPLPKGTKVTITVGGEGE